MTRRRRDLERRRRRSVDPWGHRRRNVMFGPPRPISASMNPTVQTNSPSIEDSYSPMWGGPCPDDMMETTDIPCSPEDWEQRQRKRDLEQRGRRKPVDLWEHRVINESFESLRRTSSGDSLDFHNFMLPSINITVQMNSASILDPHSPIRNSSPASITRSHGDIDSIGGLPFAPSPTHCAISHSEILSANHLEEPEDVHMPLHNQVAASTPNPIGGLPRGLSPTHSEVSSMAIEYSDSCSLISPAGNLEEPEDMPMPLHNQVAASTPNPIGELPSTHSHTHCEILSLESLISPDGNLEEPEDMPMPLHNQVTASTPNPIGGLPRGLSPTHSEVSSMAIEYSDSCSLISPAGNLEEPEDMPMPLHNQVAASTPNPIGELTSTHSHTHCEILSLESLISPDGNLEEPEDMPMPLHNQVTASTPNPIGGLPRGPSPTHSEVSSMAIEYPESCSLISPAGNLEESEDMPMPLHNQVAASTPNPIGGLPRGLSPTHSEVSSMAIEYPESCSLISPAGNLEEPEDMPMPLHNQVAASTPNPIGGLPRGPSPNHSEVSSMTIEYPESCSLISLAGYQEEPEDMPMPLHNQAAASIPNPIGGLPRGPSPTHSDVSSMAIEYPESCSLITPAGNQEEPEDMPMSLHNQVAASTPNPIGGLPRGPSPTHSEVSSMAIEYPEICSFISLADHQEESEDIHLPAHNRVIASPPHVEIDITIIVGAEVDYDIQDENPIRIRFRTLQRVTEMNELSTNELP